MADKRRQFMGRTIKKETIALGVGGQLVRDDDFPELPPLAVVTFKATADYENVKHKFLESGGVEEILILTIDAKSFEVVSFEERPVQEQLQVDPNQGELGEGPAPGSEDEVTAKRRGRGRTGKDD